MPFTSDAYLQASLTPTLGGMGLRRASVHAPAAYAASFRESQGTSGETWVVPPSTLSFLGSQKAFTIDEGIHRSLVESADRRNRKRLDRLLEPHAGAFVTDVRTVTTQSCALLTFGQPLRLGHSFPLPALPAVI